MRVARRLIDKGYSELNGQSERAFDAIHCFSIFYKGLRLPACGNHFRQRKKSNSNNNYDGERCRPKLSGLSNNA